MANNFVDMEDVREEDDSLDYVLQEVWSGFINKSAPMVSVKLNEIQTELYDDRLNFMGLTPPKTINYLNADVITKDLTQDYGDFAIILTLSNKVTI